MPAGYDSRETTPRKQGRANAALKRTKSLPTRRHTTESKPKQSDDDKLSGVAEKVPTKPPAVDYLAELMATTRPMEETIVQATRLMSQQPDGIFSPSGEPVICVPCVVPILRTRTPGRGSIAESGYSESTSRQYQQIGAVERRRNTAPPGMMAQLRRDMAEPRHHRTRPSGSGSGSHGSGGSKDNNLSGSGRHRRRSSKTCLRHLDLGDTGTSTDMLQCTDPILNADLITSLKKHDFVFILRSDGEWTYAIIADIQRKSIRFVVDTKGGNKTLSRRKWMDSIRLVNNQANREKVQIPLPSLTEVSYHMPTLCRHSSLPDNLKLDEENDEEGDGFDLVFDARRKSCHSALSLFE